LSFSYQKNIGFGSGIQIRHPGSEIRKKPILDPGFGVKKAPDPGFGVKKAPDPGSGFDTLPTLKYMYPVYNGTQAVAIMGAFTGLESTQAQSVFLLTI
jgi:hypothetical protein